MQKAVSWVQCQKIVCDLSKNKSNITLYIEGQRGFKHEKMNWTFFLHKSQCNHCDRNDQETPEDFWTYPLETMFSKGLNQRKVFVGWQKKSPFEQMFYMNIVAVLVLTDWLDCCILTNLLLYFFQFFQDNSHYNGIKRHISCLLDPRFVFELK